MSQHFISPGIMRAPRRVRLRGFTLIELMIAMVLGLIVVGGVSSIFLANQQTYRSNEALSEVQDGARVAFELLARDIRVAGLTGCNATSGRVANVLLPSANNWFADWNSALIGYDNAKIDPALSGLTGAGAPVASSSSVHILSTGSISATVQKDTEPGASIHPNEKTTDLTTGDIIVICDYDHAAIVQIRYNSSSISIDHNPGKDLSPGNCSKGLGYPTDCSSNGNVYTFPPNSQIAKLTAHVWYIGTNPVGGQSLYRLAVVNQSGTGGSAIAQVPQEMVRNVTNMTISYLQKTDTQFRTATAVTTANNWAAVDSAQVTLTLQSTFQLAGTNGKPLNRTFTSTATVRNRVL